MSNELYYDPNAKLPTMLDLEDVYGKIIEVSEESIKEDRAIGSGHLAPLVDFVNNLNMRSKHGHIPELDEATFVKSWLPYLYNEEEDYGGEFSPIHAWVQMVAGSVHDCVNITRRGEVIYRVPPVVGRLNIVGAKDRKKSVGQLKREADEMISRLPKARLQQEAYLCDSIYNPNGDVERSEFVTHLNLKFIYILDEIFTYYKYESILTPKLMLIKDKIMGTSHEYNAGKPVQKLDSGDEYNQEPEAMEDDADLFGW